MLPIALPFTVAEIAHRQGQIGADYAQANAGRTPQARRHRFGAVISSGYRLRRAGAPAAG